ncbi:hypothetical protein QFZ64_000761 [Streptomyces sp. B3I8]|nr:hypothetical protein [Streptomyces sp. B3I8]
MSQSRTALSGPPAASSRASALMATAATARGLLMRSAGGAGRLRSAGDHSLTAPVAVPSAGTRPSGLTASGPAATPATLLIRPPEAF